MRERGVDGARLIADLAEAMRREQEARAWQEKMQRKLSECPGFVGCRPPGEQSPGRVTVQPGAADEAVVKRRFHVGQVGWMEKSPKATKSTKAHFAESPGFEDHSVKPS